MDEFLIKAAEEGHSYVFQTGYEVAMDGFKNASFDFVEMI